MQTTKKKPNILLIVLGAVLASYLGYLVAGAWREGIEFNAFLERFEMVCAYPLKDYFNEYTFRMIGYVLAAYAIGDFIDRGRGCNQRYGQIAGSTDQYGTF